MIKRARSTVLLLVTPSGCNSSAHSPTWQFKTHAIRRIAHRTGMRIQIHHFFWRAVSAREPLRVPGAFAHLQEDVQIRYLLSDVELQTSSTPSAQGAVITTRYARQVAVVIVIYSFLRLSPSKPKGRAASMATLFCPCSSLWTLFMDLNLRDD
jgi:hypothetical protein